MHEDLLEQAKDLLSVDPRKPKQANLRRAVSAAYYALFHYLVDKSARQILGTAHEKLPYRNVLARAYSHSDLKRACKAFSGGTLTSSISKSLPDFKVPAEVKALAQALVDLQDQRHTADYDLSATFSRSTCSPLVKQVDAAITGFERMSNTNEKAFFLACLWAYRALDNR